MQALRDKKKRTESNMIKLSTKEIYVGKRSARCTRMDRTAHKRRKFIEVNVNIHLVVLARLLFMGTMGYIYGVIMYQNSY